MTDNVSALQRVALSVPDACKVSGVGRTKLFEAIRSGKLVARKNGKRTLILHQDLLKFLEDLPKTA
jgi:excisionase family DNA binding protein